MERGIWKGIWKGEYGKKPPTRRWKVLGWTRTLLTKHPCVDFRSYKKIWPSDLCCITACCLEIDGCSKLKSLNRERGDETRSRRFDKGKRKI